MSQLISFETLCTYCQHPNEAEVWSAINVKTDPELKDILLGGELNMIECAACKEIFYAEHFLLYHDPDMELMAFVYPHTYAEEKEKWMLKTEADFAQTQVNAEEGAKLAYEPMTLFGLDQLVFTVEDEEENAIQSEIANLLSPGNEFEVKRLRPSVARARGLPIGLPYIGSVPTRDTVMAGAAKLLSINDRLTVFAKFLERLKTDSSIDLQVPSQ